jgi:DNA-binding response OmpR family regulator
MAAEWGATAWLTKPFNHEALVAALHDKPNEEPTRGFVWREGSLVFVVGPPRDSWALAERLVDEGGVALVVVDGGRAGESLAFAEYFLGRAGPLRAIGFASADGDARRRWSLLRPGERTVLQAFSDLTQAVEWTAVRADMAATLRPRATSFVDSPDAVRPRVLVVDDDPPIRLLVGRFLTKLGAEVLTACNVDEAEELLADGPVDAAIIDKNMPGRSGMTLLRKLETEAIGVATVMMTADPTEATRAEAGELGALAYLEKPFALSELERALSSALRGVVAKGGHGRLEAVTEMLREMSAWARRRR